MTHFTQTAILFIGALFASAASAQEYTLRIQLAYGPETISGELAQTFADDVEVMSGGRVNIELFFSSSLVKSVETFDAAISGILDADMTGATYQTGKNPAFQFVGDIMGGYETPWQQYAWLYHNGGYDMANALYNQYGMQLIGWWIYGQEAMSSSVPLAGPADLKEWKFRSPPGLESEIFAEMGAKPVVMDFVEIFTALESGIIDGADASGIANNRDLGLYDLVGHATYPGFHSMPADHLAINRKVWDGLPEDIQQIIEVAMQKLAFQTALTFEVENHEAAVELRAQGIRLHSWSEEDRKAFREAAQTAWQRYAEQTPEARELVDSHVVYMKELGLIEK